jgi:N6-adenosine-specific RNA methylase IME4
VSDCELLNMGVAQLQDDGVIFMWVTGEAPQAVLLRLTMLRLEKWGLKAR